MEEGQRWIVRLEDLVNIDVRQLFEQFNSILRLRSQNPTKKNLLRLFTSSANKLEEKCQTIETLLRTCAQTVEDIAEGNLNPHIPNFQSLD